MAGAWLAQAAGRIPVDAAVLSTREFSRPMLRTILAGNASPMTLDGTRVYIVGRSDVAIIDPGPDTEEHLDAIEEVVGPASVTAILVTHAHPDHDAAASPLARRFNTTVRARRLGSLTDGDRIPTDSGELVALATPGHAPDHFAFHWPAERAIFCGDLMMGGSDTALVAAPEGSIGEYIASLERLRTLSPSIIYPAHGPAVESPGPAIDRYIEHRRYRELQVLQSLGDGPKDVGSIVADVYGTELPEELRRWTGATVQAYLEHLENQGRVEREGRKWRKLA